ALAMSGPDVLPSVSRTTSAPGMRGLSRLNGWPVRPPVNASRLPSRAAAHDSGPMWIATPSLRWTCTIYSLPVSLRFSASPQKRTKSARLGEVRLVPKPDDTGRATCSDISSNATAILRADLAVMLAQIFFFAARLDGEKAMWPRPDKSKLSNLGR